MVSTEMWRMSHRRLILPLARVWMEAMEEEGRDEVSWSVPSAGALYDVHG